MCKHKNKSKKLKIFLLSLIAFPKLSFIIDTARKNNCYFSTKPHFNDLVSSNPLTNNLKKLDVHDLTAKFP